MTTTGMTGARAHDLFDGQLPCVAITLRAGEHRRALVGAADAVAEGGEQLAAGAVRRVVGDPGLAVVQVDVDLEPAGLGVHAHDVAVAHA